MDKPTEKEVLGLELVVGARYASATPLSIIPGEDLRLSSDRRAGSATALTTTPTAI